MKSWIVDEEAVVDEVEKIIRAPGEEEDEGGWLIDWHACDLFPRSWVDLVVVLRCERTDLMWDRLKARYVDTSLMLSVVYTLPALMFVVERAKGVLLATQMLIHVSVQGLPRSETTREPRRGDLRRAPGGGERRF